MDSAAIESTGSTGSTRQSAREALIDAAEHLFGTKGLDGVSTRQILDLAGQKNQSALQYHFSGRSGLLWAVIESRLQAIEVARQVLLTDLPPVGSETPEQLANVFIRPLADFVAHDPRGSAFIQFNIQFTHKPGANVIQLIESKAFPAMTEMFERLHVMMARLPENVRPLRQGMIVTTAIGAIALWDTTGKEKIEFEEFVQTAIAATVAIIKLP